jgi:hypothetical protein
MRTLLAALLLSSSIAHGSPSAPSASARPAVARPRARVAPRAFQRKPLRRAPTPIADTRFALIGDSGTGQPEQLAVADELIRQYERAPFGRLIMLGDNVYSNGELENFGKALAPYQPLIDADVRILGILGNHDIRTNRGRDQLRFYGITGRRWYKSLLAGGQVEVFFLDTTLFIPNQRGYREGHEGWRINKGKQELKWLARSLAASRAPYKVVIGHHPLYSSGGNGKSSEGTRMQAALGPVLRGQGVALYVSGHDHHYERFAPVDGITHIVSGNAGGRPNRYPLEDDKPLPGSQLIRAQPQLMTFDVKPDGLHFRSIDSTGAVLDQGVLAAAPRAAR